MFEYTSGGTHTYGVNGTRARGYFTMLLNLQRGESTLQCVGGLPLFDVGGHDSIERLSLREMDFLVQYPTPTFANREPHQPQIPSWQRSAF